MESTNVYVLKLERGRWYIGKSKNIVERLQEHLNGTGSAWTKQYKPVQLETTYENVSPFEEDKVTKEYMAKYGIERVRGGTYVAETLETSQLDSLKKEIWAATNCCTNCGRKGHFVKDCFAKTDIHGNRLECEEVVWGCSKCAKEFEKEKDCEMHERLCVPKQARQHVTYNACYRCGRTGHYANNCYASTSVQGEYLDSDSDSDSDSDFYDSDD